jgi:TolA-binding protein
MAIPKTKSRGELKENVLAHRVENIAKWIVDHRTWAMAAVGGLILVALGSSVIIIRRNEQKALNWLKIAQAQDLIRQQQFQPAETILLEIKTTSPHTKAGLRATYQLGEFYLERKDFEKAKEQFQMVVDRAGRSPLKPLALSNLAFSQESNGEFQSAAATYQLFMDQYAEHFLAARNQLAVGRAWYKAEEYEAAKVALGQLIDLYPTSPWAENAREIMDKIENG